VRYWLMLIAAGLMMVMVGCGPKDKSKAGKDAPPDTDSGVIAEPPGGAAQTGEQPPPDDAPQAPK